MYHMIQRGTHYQDLGENYYDSRNPEKLANRLTKRIEKLGFKVILEPLPLALEPLDACVQRAPALTIFRGGNEGNEEGIANRKFEI
jgi:hypothetical protein